MSRPANNRLPSRIAAVRRFNRAYTQKIGALDQSHLDSPYSLTQVRVLYELAHRTRTTATALASDLGLDPGYLSRMLRNFQGKHLIEKSASKSDARQSLLTMTAKGRNTFAPLDARANAHIAGLLHPLSDAEQSRLVDAMQTVETLLAGRREQPAPWLLRPPRVGDMGWVVYRHAVLYAREYGFDERFEALVAEIVAKFMRHFDPKRERCWIAERDGENIGCVFLVKHTADTAKLRLFLVEPAARGLGIGKRLTQECLQFARQAGYRKVTLWTQSVLGAARHIYRQAGFKIVHREVTDHCGPKLTAETWELAL